MLIVPKEHRVLVYTVRDNLIINAKQRESYPAEFIQDASKISKLKIECLMAMNNTNNLYSFVYVFSNGSLEKEVNTIRPKFPFHADYNND